MSREMHGNRSHLWRVPMQNDAGVVDMGQRTVDDFRAKFIDQNLYRRAYRGMCSSRFWKGGGGAESAMLIASAGANSVRVP